MHLAPADKIKGLIIDNKAQLFHLGTLKRLEFAGYASRKGEKYVQ
jgi:hypothetical protein